MNKQTIAIIIALAGGVAVAHGDDHVIRPQCWDENVNGTVQRHCEVKRPAQAPAPRLQASAPPPIGTPIAAPPVRSWPTRACLYGPPPCPVYYDGAPAPAYGPMAPAYGVPSPGYYPYPPAPGFVFGFGPFSIWIPS